MRSMSVLPPPAALQVASAQELDLRVTALRKGVQAALEGAGWLVIIGPCSLNHTGAMLHLAERAAVLQRSLPEHWRVLLRVCFEKPRTAGGWKGWVHETSESSDPVERLRTLRELLARITLLGVGVTAELLSPLLFPYVSDLLSHGWIGARSSICQVHRELASLASFPVGIKNELDGSFMGAVHSAREASKPHSLYTLSHAGQPVFMESVGNPRSHVIVRGGVQGPNYGSREIETLELLLATHGLSRYYLVDCAHGNSRGKSEEQLRVAQATMELPHARGWMIEAHRQEGRQEGDPDSWSPWTSVTDPCVAWDDAEAFLLEAAQKRPSLGIGDFNPLEPELMRL